MLLTPGGSVKMMFPSPTPCPPSLPLSPPAFQPCETAVTKGLRSLTLCPAGFWPWGKEVSVLTSRRAPSAPAVGQRRRGKTSGSAGSAERGWQDLVSPWKTRAGEENPGDPAGGSPGLQHGQR